jgi:3',5'-cyclic AMP phosphodiesterase CpdA
MKEIAHLSDLHFGAHDPLVAEALLAELDGRAARVPSLVAVSGDLTQRAREAQFAACRDWLARVPAPTIVLPGNHDVPLYDLAARLLHPLERFRRAITPELAPVYLDDELVVAGVCTAHGLTVKGGRLTPAQTSAAAAVLAAHPDRYKILVAHHPFVPPPGSGHGDSLDDAETIVPVLEDAGLQLILSGHLHVAYLADTAAYRTPDKAIVSVLAGTCMSTRRRGEANGYNRLVLDGDTLQIVQRVFDGTRFVDGATKLYARHAGFWHKLEEQKAA